MPRMLANEFVYSSTSDERYNEYITPTSPPLSHYHHQPQQHHQVPAAALTASMSMQENINSKSRSQSPPQQMTSFPQALHTVSSSDDDEGEKIVSGIQHTPDEVITSIISDDMEDFEGFDEKSVMQVYNQEDDTHIRCHLKRHSHADYNDYREDSEGVVEAIEVDDEDIVEVDGQIMYRSKRERTPIKTSNRYTECNPHTPNKRKKRQSDGLLEAISPPHLKTPPDQIVEINSDSTTISQKQKRQQINTKFQLNLNQKQNHKTTNNAAANKCSTESTSEFPVSSPSNPQQPRGGGKYPPRPPLLKNTLPADSFERQLAMITACNPQMTLAEKLQSWCCEDELSDVEDVNMFDQEFKRLEERRKSELTKQKNKKSTGTDNQYNFAIFRQMIINNMNAAQKNKKKYTAAGAGAGGFSSATTVKGHDESSGSSESSKSIKHMDERPSTSAVAQQQLQQRRCKPPINMLEPGEMKKRLVKELPRRNQNSTTPPATSSSENDRDCFQNSKISGPHKRFPSGQIQIHEKLLCQSSSEEANSQDVPTHMQLKSNQDMSQNAINNIRNKSPIKSGKQEDNTNSKNLRCLAAEEIDSVFRLHRLNREIDKDIRTALAEDNAKHPGDENRKEVATGDLIQIQEDCNEDNKIPQLSTNKKQDLFKTPTVPPKYFVSHTSAESPTPTCSSPTKNIATEHIATSAESHQIANCTNTATAVALPPSDVKSEIGADNDFDGVYHQQHEFCNYLGLTGMSTATAMANAVAELAQCNLTRRSMRVLRQQQLERKEKSAKEEREQQALKVKQLKESSKRERGGNTVLLEDEEQLLEEGTNSQTSEPTHSNPSVKGAKKKTTSIASMTTKSSSKSQPSVTIVKKGPQIKILCHIEANTNKEEEAEKVSKEDVQPTREKLMRQVKQRKYLKDHFDTSADTKEEKEIKYEIKTECFHAEELKLEETASTSDTHKRILRSPRLSAMKSKLKFTKSKTNLQEDVEQQPMQSEQFLKEQKETTCRLEIQTPPPHFKIETLCDSLVATPNKCRLKSSPLTSYDNKTKDLNIAEASPTSSGDDALANTDRSLTPTSLLIKDKLQAALQESRKTKPSIFIVQSLDSKKELATKSVSILDSPEKSLLDVKPTTNSKSCRQVEISPTVTSPPKVEIRKHMSNKLSELATKVAEITKKKVVKKLLKVRKAKTHAISSLRSAPKRELRARKIIVIKTSKSENKHKNKKTKDVREIKSQKSLSKHKLPKSPHSSLKIKESVKKCDTNSQGNNAKSFRNAQTETNDLEMYNSQSKTRLMAKASALLQRSRRMSLSRGSSKNLRSKLSSKLHTPTISSRGTKSGIVQPKVCLRRTNVEQYVNEYKSSSTSSPTPKAATTDQNGTLSNEETEALIENVKSSCHVQENDNVVVSSTTNSYDERPPPHANTPLIPSSNTLRSVHSSASYAIASATVETKDSCTQSDYLHGGGGIQYLNAPPAATQTMRNPLKMEHGVVHYIYYEVDILIVVQERLISFWKSSRLLNALSTQLPSAQQQQPKLLNMQQTKQNEVSTPPPAQNKPDILCNSYSSIGLQLPQATSSYPSLEPHINGEWILLGELKRLTYDLEVFAPFANRICLHNSTPIYVEMRARKLPKNHRDCNLLSMYINIYYYHDEDMIAKRNSIQLDTIQSDVDFVNYTTLVDSRYFIMTWPQENLLGKTRSGMCKYSLTPQLDTLASIREFKSMRHTIRYLECMSDDKLVGFGESQLTVWDHRSGDVLMNYDLDMPLGRNLGSVYYPSQEIEQNNMITLFQYRDLNPDEQPPELLTIACTIAHTQPSYRILQQQQLPPTFKAIQRAINTGEHLVITAANEEEIWICCNNPSLVALVPQQQYKRRFFNRERSQLIELTEKALNFDTLANHVLQLAAGLALRNI